MNLVNKILLGVGAALALVIVITFIWLSLANAHLKAQLAETQANSTACHLANGEFIAKVAQQNKAVEQLRIAGAAQTKRAQEAVIFAQKIARIYLRAAEKLRKAKPHGDACQATDTIINTYLNGAP
jgi:hypothetical protein